MITKLLKELFSWLKAHPMQGFFAMVAGAFHLFVVFVMIPRSQGFTFLPKQHVKVRTVAEREPQKKVEVAYGSNSGGSSSLSKKKPPVKPQAKQKPKTAPRPQLQKTAPSSPATCAPSATPSVPAPTNPSAPGFTPTTPLYRQTSTDSVRKGKKTKELLQEIETAFAQLEKTESAAFTPLSIELSGETEKAYASLLVPLLKESLKLPDNGEVKMSLTLKEDGSVIKVVVLKAESSKNRRYLEKEIAHLKFPPLDQEKTFVLTFCNEI